MTKKDAQPGLLPRLRFPEFRDAPAWSESALTGICDVNPTHDGLPESFYYINLESVEAGTLQSPQLIDRANAPSRAQRLLQDGDILYQTVRPYQRNNLLFNFTDGEDYVASTGYAQLRARESVGFLYQLVHTDSFVKRVLTKCTGSNYPAINSSDLESVAVWIPPDPAEQKKIALCLGSLDDLITAEGRKLAALRDHKKGLMQQLFPREGETRPRLRFPEFRDAGEWKAWPLAKLAREISDGDWIESKDQSPSGIRLVQTGNIGEGLFINKDGNARFISEDTFKRLRCKEIHLGDCLISRLPDPIGRACLVPDIGSRMITAVDCAIVRFRSDRIVPYLFIISSQRQGYYREIESLASGSTRKRISRTKLAEVVLHLPAMPEQQRIADCLASLDAMITAQAEKLDALRTHKRSLMQQLFPAPEDIITGGAFDGPV